MTSTTRTAGTTARRAALCAAAAAGVLLACAPRVADRIPLQVTDRVAVSSDSAERVEELTLRMPDGDSITAFLRAPTEATASSLGGVVLVAGRETGRRAAAVVPGPLGTAVLAVEYPQALPEDLTVSALLDRLPEIRSAALRMPGILRGAARFLADEPAVDSTRMAMVGVSFGVPFAAAAGSDPLFRGVALHHGGAGLDRILEANLPVENGLLRSIAAELLGWYFRSLEPARHVDDLGATPLLLINGRGDTRIPESSVLLLARAASGPVELMWLPHEHLMPGDTALMRVLADSTLSRFEFLRPSGSPAAAGAGP